MASNLDDSLLARRVWAVSRSDESERWPPFASLCFAGGASALLWLSLISLVSLLA